MTLGNEGVIYYNLTIEMNKEIDDCSALSVLKPAQSEKAQTSVDMNYRVSFSRAEMACDLAVYSGDASWRPVSCAYGDVPTQV